jgi:hypothetical protein
MITPVVIQVIFWIGVVVVAFQAFSNMRYDFFSGLLLLILGPIIVRVYTEILIVLFKMNDWLGEINQSLSEIKNQVEQKTS